MRTLVILLVLFLLAGCAVVPVAPYDTYGPYYSYPYYYGPAYGYYGPAYEYYGSWYYVPEHHRFRGEHRGHGRRGR
jgi:hypothetical protein